MSRTKIAKSMKRTAADQPLTPDQLLAQDNVAATKPTPAWIEERLSERIVHISGGGSGNRAGEQKKRIDKGGSSSFRLAPGEFLGRLGKSSGFSPMKAAKARGEDRTTKPFRPAWQDYIYHPKLTVARSRQILHRRSGRRVLAHEVYSPENRTVFSPVGYPMHCIGRLLVWDTPGTTRPQRSGSAVLVGSRVVLTCAHLMPRNGSPGMWGVLFVPGYFDGASVAGVNSWCEAYRVAPGFAPDDAHQAFDISVMKLYDPLGDALGYFGARTYKSGWEDEERWTLVGYPGAIANAERPSMQSGIAVIDDDPDGKFAEIEHRGDASDGNSGGPLFGAFPDGPYVIAVHAGYEYRTIDIPLVPTIVAENNNVAAGGTGMVDMIRAARADWP